MRNFAAISAALMIVSLLGCGPKNEGATTAAGTSSGGSSGIKAAMVTDTGGIDDQSFNTGSWEGLQKAYQEKLIDKPRYLESREQSDYKTNLSTLAEQGYNVVFAVGFLMEDALKEVAPNHPNTKFAIIDGSAPTGADGKVLPNCVSLKFREEEGSFLAGYLAGRMTKTGAIGFVGGMDSALIKKFEVGYYSGAKTARPDIRVIPGYVGNFKDLGTGRSIAEEQFRQGADIIFAAAGTAGKGVLDAANAKGPGFYAIGVDKDQDDVRPGRVLTSMMKTVDGAVYETVKSVHDGKWSPGERVVGVKEGGVHLSPMKYTKQDVPPDVLAKIDQLSKMIAEGQIKVPTTEDERQSFVPPKL
jgi:basic membrane protein A and related proteins